MMHIIGSQSRFSNYLAYRSQVMLAVVNETMAYNTSSYNTDHFYVDYGGGGWSRGFKSLNHRQADYSRHLGD